MPGSARRAPLQLILEGSNSERPCFRKSEFPPCIDDWRRRQLRDLFVWIGSEIRVDEIFPLDAALSYLVFFVDPPPQIDVTAALGTEGEELTPRCDG